MTAALAFRTAANHDATTFGATAYDSSTYDAARAEDSFTLEDYVSLFVYDGPARPGILDSELVTLAS
ncbi:MAG TPA: hypothetical protein GXZ46_02650 [Actinomycetales bacterium]|nr:hypothetical protein [Actinomycetales bacterium]